MPIATPSADRAARRRRVRRPTLDDAQHVGEQQAAVHARRGRGRLLAAAGRRGRCTRRGSVAAISRSWVMRTTVVPRSCRSRSMSRISAPVAVSRLPVGSSASRIAGDADQRAGDRHPLALAARRAAPRCDRRGGRARRPRAPAGRAGGGGRPGCPCRAARRRRSRAPCATRAGETAGRRIRSATPAAPPGGGPSKARTSSPAIRTVPEVARSSVPITCNSVDLPEPDGPTIAHSSPSATAKSTPRSACTPPG